VYLLLGQLLSDGGGFADDSEGLKEDQELDHDVASEPRVAQLQAQESAGGEILREIALTRRRRVGVAVTRRAGLLCESAVVREGISSGVRQRKA
jgi:hypothetical protein